MDGLTKFGKTFQMHLTDVLIGSYPEPGDKTARSVRRADCRTTVRLLSKQRIRFKQRPDVTVLCERCAHKRMIRLNATEKTDERTEKD
jgi:hypothetical protein